DRRRADAPMPSRLCHACGGLQGTHGPVGEWGLLRAPLNDRLAARVRHLRRALLQGPQVGTDSPAPQHLLEALSPPENPQSQINRHRLVKASKHSTTPLRQIIPDSATSPWPRPWSAAPLAAGRNLIQLSA